MNLKDLQKEFLEKGGKIQKIPTGKIATEKSLHIMEIKDLGETNSLDINVIKRDLNL